MKFTFNFSTFKDNLIIGLALLGVMLLGMIVIFGIASAIVLTIKLGI